jgi:lathosterol oxidase
VLALAFVLGSIAVSLALLHGVGGALYRHYYVQRRSRAAEWKHQPDAWVSPTAHRRAVRLGTVNVIVGATISGALAWYVYRGGYTTLYFDFRRHGLLAAVSSPAFVFALVDAATYYAHRAFHWKPLFSSIHKWHHRYTSTTPFVVAAMHPAEFLVYQTILVLPMFLIPIHYVSYLAIVLVIYYLGIFNHSGIKSARFHDDHHQYSHCNFGQSSRLLDWLHGTLRGAEDT